MIRHCVMLRLALDADMTALAQICAELDALVQRLDGCRDFLAGPNRDFEGRSAGFPFGFTFDAKNADALAAYAVHPDHKALGARLVQLCQKGAAGIMVFDIEVTQ